MAQFAVLIYTELAPDPNVLTSEERHAHDLHADEVIEAGVMIAACALEPARTSARSIRRDGVTDGPFIDSNYVIAGFYLIETTDMDAAVEIAARNPITHQGGGVEVRAIEGTFIADRPAE